MKKKLDKLAELLFITSAIICVLALLLIMIFIFYKGAPSILETGVFKFLFGVEWQPRAEVFGILPMITASVLVTIGAILIGAPVGVLTATFIVYLAPKRIGNILKTATDVLASIPSVIYGFFGLMIIIPFIDRFLAGGAGGNSILAAIIILSIMILPTVISISESSMREVDISYRDASLALGATKISTIFKVMIPSAFSGIMAAVILGVGRALGEAMAVILVSGNAPFMPDSILAPVRTMSANIALEMGYASGAHQEALFGTGVVLFVFIFIINFIFYIVKHKGGVKN
ncbi:MAG: phosphate ABC transporter permease subunit PstC [Firmicutes bacterium]|nr:phosphate ABC transporter permease subunit PstC [Bacillota bacterium]